MLTDDSVDEEGESRASLFAELGRGSDPTAGPEDEASLETDEAAIESALAWDPEPVDAISTYGTDSRRKLDVISMLVDIYGSKELFINEY
eukprot:scaffold648665_cov34-Prasinocladus_malaysianus.AAC.1